MSNFLILRLKDIIGVLFYPTKFYSGVSNRTEKDILIYIFFISVLVQSFNYSLSYILRVYFGWDSIEYLHPTTIFWSVILSLILLYGISLLCMIPVILMRRKHLIKSEKERLKIDKKWRRKWGAEIKNCVLQAVGYGITPIILFIYPSRVFSEINYIEFLFYLSFYWIILCIISISKSCKISKLEAGISLIVPAYIVMFWIFTPPI